MFLLRLFGVMDLLAGLVLGLTLLGLIPFRIIIGFALYLFFKGYLFKGDFMSFIDMITGIILILMYFVTLSSSFFIIISIVLMLNLFQKSFFSFVTI